MSEVDKLKLEIEVLKKRISHLERIETRRKIIASIKIIIVVAIIIVICYFGYKFYNQFQDLYNKFTELSKNPLKSLF